MSGMQFFLPAMLLLPAGGLLGLGYARHNRFAHLLGAAGSIIGGGCGLIGAFLTLVSSRPEETRFFWGSGDIPFTLHLDSLAGFFLVPIFLIVIVGAIYAWSYLDVTGTNFAATRHWLAYNILAISMALVVTAADSFTFMVAWEIMSLSSFFLVVYDLKNEQARKAGWIYLGATHLGTALLFYFFFEAFRRTGSLDFASMAILRDLPLSTGVLLFALILIGFGTKAGLLPMHSWLPEAHSAAPSHVSALMSGVMIKTAIYAFLRMLTFLPEPPLWAGLLIMVLGIGGALFGIAMATIQSDIKRSLAYSTVENIGIIFLAFGLWLFCRGAGFELAARLALAGGLLHIWNHALFKSLLFMGAGAVAHASGTREMSALGGLMRKMPVTGALMVIGGAAIAALPPFNGLIGELAIYLGLFTAGKTAVGGQAFIFIFFAALLATVGGLVLLAMTRMVGIVFGGEPRNTLECSPHESPPAMLAAMLVPAILCITLGVFPQGVTQWLVGPMAILFPIGANLTTPLPLPFGPGWTLAGLLLAIVPITFIAARYRHHKPDPATTWGCGFVKPAPSMSYTAGGFAELIQDEIFCGCLRPDRPVPGQPKLFPTARLFRPLIVDPVLNQIFIPLFTRVADLANSCRRLQAGSMNIYIAYIFLATLLLLGWNYCLV